MKKAENEAKKPTKEKKKIDYNFDLRKEKFSIS